MKPVVTSAKVIPWEERLHGVAVEFSNGRKRTYCVGSREEAEREVRRLTKPTLGVVGATKPDEA